MLTDHDIEQVLAPLRPITHATVPMEGEWTQPPFPEMALAGHPAAVLCEDPNLSSLAVDRVTGAMFLVSPEGTRDLVNSSPGQFVACALAFSAAVGRAVDEDGALEDIAATLLETLAGIDPDAVHGENQAWAIAAEELGYGF